MGEADDGQECKAFQFVVGGTTCHGRFAKTVDVGLYDYIGKRNHAVLHTGRKSVANNVHKTFFVKPDFFYRNPIGCVNPQQMDEAKQCTDTLGNGGCDSSRTNPKLKYRHKQHIQSNVDAS